jgi:hypothetical protein
LIVVDPAGENPLRGIANLIGRRYGIIDENEQSIRSDVLETKLLKHGFSIKNRVRMNMISEINAHLLTIFRNGVSDKILLFLLRLSNMVDAVAERIGILNLSGLAWRYMTVANRE